MEKVMTLKDHVYDYIATQIQQGTLSPNEKIDENVICKSLNISRTPVREALIELAASGVLENQARKGFVVRSMTNKDVSDLYSVIGVLDGYAAKLACDNLTDQDMKDMEFYIDTMDVAIKMSNYQMYHKHQFIFHQIYIDKCGNKALIENISRSKNLLLRKEYALDNEENLKEVLYQTNNEHRKILNLFVEKRKDELMNFLLEVHWRPTYAEFEIV